MICLSLISEAMLKTEINFQWNFKKTVIKKASYQPSVVKKLKNFKATLPILTFMEHSLCVLIILKLTSFLMLYPFFAFWCLKF